MRLLPPTPDDRPFLAEMLVEAAFPLTPERRPGALEDDHLARYLDAWGDHPRDVGLVAWDGDRRLGAAWAVHLPAERPGYGWVAPDVPELAVAAAPGQRGRGVGRALVNGVLDGAAAHGSARVSLSVSLRNEVAHGLYRALGFVETSRRETGSVTMVAPSNPRPPVEGEVISAGHSATEEDGPALARLRRVMVAGMDVVDEGDWVQPFLARWPEEQAAGRWVGALVTAPDGRAVASALAVSYSSPPAPGRPDGRVAHVGSVATDPAWRRRGAARAALSVLLGHLDAEGVQSTTLHASADGAALYASLGYRPSAGRALRRPHP